MRREKKRGGEEEKKEKKRREREKRDIEDTKRSITLYTNTYPLLENLELMIC